MYLQKKSIWIWIVFTEGGLGFGLYLREKLIEVFGFGFWIGFGLDFGPLWEFHKGPPISKDSHFL